MHFLAAVKVPDPPRDRMRQVCWHSSALTADPILADSPGGGEQGRRPWVSIPAGA